MGGSWRVGWVEEEGEWSYIGIRGFVSLGEGKGGVMVLVCL